MSSMLIVGGVVIAVVVALAVVAVVLSRRRREPPVEDEPLRPFLSSAPTDTFSVLGAPERPMESNDDDLRLDWGQQEDVGDDLLAPEAAPGEERGRGILETAEDRADTAADRVDMAADLAQTARGRPDDGLLDPPKTPAAASPDARRQGAGGPSGTAPASRMVPLSEVIVTTSRKLVDLEDGEVRRMLTDLVRYEIDQATEFSEAGQSVDAVLQLTEAEKVSRALGMDETAERIRKMMRELQD
jgi:hypothetical protein